MKTPIVDFVKSYNKSGFSRFHMPGHKGKKILGCEKLDITEILGADVLSCASGIINQSEQNATALFDTQGTFYSTEGATLAIKAMLNLAFKFGQGKTIVATRNCHTAFINACALLDLNVKWIYPETSEHFCCCSITEQKLVDTIKQAKEKPFAVYVTSPDYAGNICDIKTLAKVCKNEHIPLLVDNAHGAYTAFIEPTLHPIKLGATMCVDSAHKTLPVLTGGAYLHIAKGEEKYCSLAKQSLAVFASTSPSYLTLQSLDYANLYLYKHTDKYNKLIDKINCLKLELISYGYPILSGEPLKIVINAINIGYSGETIATMLRKFKIEPEMADSQIVVLMLSPFNTDKDLKRLKKALLSIEIKAPLLANTTAIAPSNKAMSIRQALFSKSENIEVDCAEGRVASSTYICCPPGISAIVPGEEITKQTIQLLKEMKTEKINVVK